MVLHLSKEQAAHLLANYHFTPTDLPGVFTRLGSVQYDPLNPVGRNPDLVLQARVPGYKIDDWQKLAYGEPRQIYDAWDKQACLVPVADWPMRAMTRKLLLAYHDREIIASDSQTVETILQALDTRGPLSSLEFERKPAGEAGSWSGSTQAKRILRALWVKGDLVTHHRQGGRHYYDRAERVIPAVHYQQSTLSENEYYHWVIARRFQAVGLLRPNAEAAIWASCGDSATRKRSINELVEAGTITPVEVGERKTRYYAYTAALPQLEQPALEPRIIFMGPLDSLLWDRKALQEVFNFDYLWEVYKPEPLRKWGYYVLPVFYGKRFIGRIDSRLEKGIWKIARWWWEPDVTITDELVTALQSGMARFLSYMGATDIQASETLDTTVLTAITGLHCLQS